ncbi:G-protein coupled receptor 26 [Electrophorus electricus]|uniref:G-protein coupled receptor 26 n=1 Tax=Electrophorus electricus TaxID=8005 RepID=A0A4W4GRD1_ELEEL|nr:G-protein coupled receptor 26 [Electrophorus electricus]
MDFAEILVALFIVVIAVVSLLSNLLVLLCFINSSEIRKQVPGIFVMNLSFCNILITIVNMPSTLVGIIRKQQPFGDCLCHAVSFLETFLTANTMLSMAALSIDRWIAVVFPLSYSSKMRYRDALVMVCYSWLHSLTFSLIALLSSWVGYHHVYASCTLHLTEENARIKFTVFTVVYHATSFMLSLLILCVTYLKVLKVARFHCKRIDIITMQTLFLLVDIHPSVKQRCIAEQKKRKQRATKKISIFIGSFIICFAPYVITRLAELLPFVDINRHWGIFSRCLTYSKAASDPFAYSLLRQQYKKALVTGANRLLKRDLYPSSGHNSSLDTENDYCLQRIS